MSAAGPENPRPVELAECYEKVMKDRGEDPSSAKKFPQRLRYPGTFPAELEDIWCEICESRKSIGPYDIGNNDIKQLCRGCYLRTGGWAVCLWCGNASPFDERELCDPCKGMELKEDVLTQTCTKCRQKKAVDTSELCEECAQPVEECHQCGRTNPEHTMPDGETKECNWCREYDRGRVLCILCALVEVESSSATCKDCESKRRQRGYRRW